VAERAEHLAVDVCVHVGSERHVHPKALLDDLPATSNAAHRREIDPHNVDSVSGQERRGIIETSLFIAIAIGIGARRRSSATSAAFPGGNTSSNHPRSTSAIE
jgi:hypothetical protein